MNDIYWIGPRESDIDAVRNIFKGSITIYGSNKNGNRSFCKKSRIQINHNIHHKCVDDFIESELYSILNNNSDVQFLFYDQSYAFCFSDDILEHTIGLKSKNVYDAFADKLRSRIILQNTVNVIPFISAYSNTINYDFLCNNFLTDRFVVQEVTSSGGEGTFLYEKNSTIKLSESDRYIVSPYIEDSVSINTHVFITDRTYYVFPSSVQISKIRSDRIIYHGADYICYEQFLYSRNKDVIINARKVCAALQKYGYRGVAGIDWLVTHDKILFVEINTRFQASTDLLNRAMVKIGNTSMHKLQIQYFTGNLFSFDGFDIKVSFSNYTFTADDITYNQLSVIEKSNEVIDCQRDGFDFPPLQVLVDNPYMCRVVFERNICSVSQGKLLLHPNLNIKPLYKLFDNFNSLDLALLKNAILNHGIRVTEDALEELNYKGTLHPAVFDALDIVIFDNIYINTPYKCFLTSFSPFCIKLTAQGTALFFDDRYICKAEIILTPKALEARLTASGIKYDSIMQFSTDRVRINPAPVCIYKRNGKACSFCNLPSKNADYTIDDVKEVIDTCLRELEFRHFLIGGGTISENGGWSKIIDICSYIRSLCDKGIYIMTIPPKDISVLKELKNAGVTEVAYNLEIFNRKLAREIMPAKGYISSEVYKNAFIESVKLWGATGKVRSLIIYGFDNDKAFLEGIEQLCSWGVEPIISCFRPLANTQLSMCMPPDTLSVLNIYKESRKIALRYNLDLGPDCIPCRNNTISNVK